MNGITAFALSDPIARLLGEWSMGLNTYSIILRIAVAVIFASVIGCERSSKRHSAGLRTFVLISFASTVSMILDIYLMMSYSFSVPVLSAATIIGTAMVSGNSILFSSRNQIKGLTTSAGLWACGILGFTIGAGLYTVTVIVYVFLLCILACFPSLEIYLKNRSNHFEIHPRAQEQRISSGLRRGHPPPRTENRRHRIEPRVCRLGTERLYDNDNDKQRGAEKNTRRTKR
ncbi:MAG: MgtC/SapB family protein [Acutalibacteraceae bacterium]